MVTGGSGTKDDPFTLAPLYSKDVRIVSFDSDYYDNEADEPHRMLDTVVEGNRFTLPKDAHPPKQYTFRGWWLNVKLYQPGDTVTLTDYVTTFKTVYDDGKEEMPEITTQPQDYTGIIGATGEFTVEATGENLTYQWQFKDGANWKDSGMEGTKTPQLCVPITEARIGQQYRCIVTSGNGTNATSNAAKLTVTK